MRRYTEGDLDWGWLFSSRNLLFIDVVGFLDFASDYICRLSSSRGGLPCCTIRKSIPLNALVSESYIIIDWNGGNALICKVDNVVNSNLDFKTYEL